jgi:hypothetical protein
VTVRHLALAVALLLACEAPLRADKSPPPSESAPPAVRVTAFLLQHPGVDDPKTVPVMRVLEDGLKRNPRLEFKDLDTRLADFAQEIPQEQIDVGRLLFSEGQKALASLELPTALKKLQSAVDALARVLPFIKKQELADAMMALGAAQFEDGDKKGAQKTFLRLLTWRSDFRLDTTKYPPQLIQPVEDARHEVDKTRRGSLEIRTRPPAAQAYVDGRYVGVTPTFAEGLPIGEHFVTLKKEGWHKAVMAAQVSARVQQVVEVPLERSRKYLLVEQALAAVEKALGKPELDRSADNLKEVLFIDHAVFLRIKPATANALDIDAFLYDVRTRRRLTRFQRTVPTAAAEAELATLTQALYANVSYEAVVEAPKDAPPPRPLTRAPVYKTWWFWTVAGALVTGAVLAGTLAPAPPKSCAQNAFCFGVSY